jgi:hypothetical protein
VEAERRRSVKLLSAAAKGAQTFVADARILPFWLLRRRLAKMRQPYRNVSEPQALRQSAEQRR